MKITYNFVITITVNNEKTPHCGRMYFWYNDGNHMIKKVQKKDW